MYMRVKDDIITITSPNIPSKEYLNKFINNNIDFIKKSINKSLVCDNKIHYL